MEEKQVLCQVKEYMDDLVRGVDPVGGESLPEESVLRWEQLVKCFRYVSRILGQELDRQKEQERALEAEAALKREVDLKEAALKEAAGKIMTIRDFMMKSAGDLGFTGWRPFLNRAAAEWLAREGYLEGRDTVEPGNPSADDFKRGVYAVTPKGKALGLLEKEQEENGKVTILCSERCQGFLQGSMDKILEFEQKQWAPLLNCLTPQWYAHASCLEEADTLTALMRQINSQLPSDLPRRVNVIQAFSWLERKGLVEDRFIESNRKVHYPTFEGKQLGLGMTNARRSVLFLPSAQMFIKDNLGQIVRDLASGDAYRLGPDPQKLTGVQDVVARISFDQEEQTLYEMEYIINQALSSLKEGACRLPGGVIWIWLHRGGYIENQRAGSKKTTVITDSGKAMGVFIDEKGYFSVNKAGQHFVAKHLEDIWNLYLELLNKLTDNDK